ncbi:hypothetical protein B0H14DRAFT_3871928 [Mycena olivaceomarginata]|nr:hypothetical protein B0H14DRAFT_3871928 [Mycena olivaceomarginata]
MSTIVAKLIPGRLPPSHSRPSSSQDCKSTWTIRWPTTSGSPTASSARNARPSYIPDPNVVIVQEKETSEIPGAAHLLSILGACLCLRSGTVALRTMMTQSTLDAESTDIVRGLCE